MGFLGISGNTWKKVGKYALQAAPIIAAPFTGGASLIALGAGTGALSGFLGGGGLKGALLGGALGAIPGGGAGGAAAGGAAKAGVKSLATGLAKGAATNFASGTATGLATGQGLKNSLAGGGQSALSGIGTTGAGGFGQAAKTVAKNTALGAGSSYAAKGLQQAGVPGAIAQQGGNVFSNYLGNQFNSSTAPAGQAGSTPKMSSFLPQAQAPATQLGTGGFDYKGALGKAGISALGGLANNAAPAAGGGGGGATGGGTGGGGSTSAPAQGSGFWGKYGPLIAQGAGVAVGAYAGKKATESAAKRSPEELAAIAGVRGSADQASQLGGQLAQQGRNYQEKPAQYFQSLLGGNRAAMSQAVAGPTAQITGNYRGAERGLDQAGVRGAARDQARVDLNRQRVSQIAGLTTGMQPYAAEQLAGMGKDMVAQAPGLLGTASQGYGSLLGPAYQNRVYSRQEGEKTASAIGGLARDVGEVAFKKGTGGVATPPPAKKPPKPLGVSTKGPNTVNLPGSVPLGSPPPPTLPVQTGMPSQGSAQYPFGTGDYDPNRVAW